MYQIYEFDWLNDHGNRKAKFAERKFNSHLRNHKGGEAKNFAEMFITSTSTEIMFFIAVAHVL